MRIAIVHDDATSAGLLSTYLKGAEFHVTGIFSSGEEVLERILSADGLPDIVIMDLLLPGISGIETTRLLKERHPDVEVVIQTVCDDRMAILEAIKAGASGCLLKGYTKDDLHVTLREVLNGGSFLSGKVARMVLKEFQQPKSKRFGLTDREEEILLELVKGSSYKKIADRLRLSVHTVNNHIRKIYEKMQVHSRGEAVAKLTRH
jgi:DNA-binding NarL/FixJ family response regulator